MSTGTTKLDVVVSDVVPVNDLVKRFHFRRRRRRSCCRPSPAAPMSWSRCATATAPGAIPIR